MAKRINTVNFDNILQVLNQSAQTFQAKSYIKTREKFLEVIYSNDRGVYLFDGEAGSGKSTMIKSIYDSITSDIYLIQTPPINIRELLDEMYFLLRGKRFSQTVKLDEIKIRVNDAFKKINHTVIIDNLRDDNLELIKQFNKISEEFDGLKILFSMDTVLFNNEDPILLFTKGFKDRITLKPLIEDDIVDYFNVLKEDFSIEFSELIKHSYVVYDITGGRFYKLYRLLLGIFDILKLAHSENIEKYQEISECIIIMSAIDKELIHG